jgi:hypothetical protein
LRAIEYRSSRSFVPRAIPAGPDGVDRGYINGPPNLTSAWHGI